jgi:type II secretory pathway pseudopilin PulG
MRAQRGFTYVGLLLAVALAGVALAAAGMLWSTTAKRDKEAELLFVGDQFRRAIGSYYEGTPGAKRYPQRLADLLEDKRLAVTRRHLRQIYADPMTGQPDWDLVRLPDGAIGGVHSRSEATPLKVANFAPSDESFANAASYRDWVFAYAPQGGGGAAKPAAAAPPGGTSLSTTPPVFGAPPAEQPPPARQTARVPRDPAVCGAVRAGDLRDCGRAGFADEALLEECRQVAARRYRACLTGGDAE